MPGCGHITGAAITLLANKSWVEGQFVGPRLTPGLRPLFQTKASLQVVTLTAESEGDRDVFRVVVADVDPVIASFGEELTVPFAPEGDAASYVPSGFVHRVRRHHDVSSHSNRVEA